MFPSKYTLGNHAQDTATLRREPTDENSKMFTTIFDGDSSNINNNCDDSLQEYYPQHQQQSSSETQSSFTHMTPTSSMSNPASWNMFRPVSPASPTSSCFSSSGNDTETEFDSVYSSPAVISNPFPSTSAVNTSIDAVMMVDHLDEDSVAYSDLFSPMDDFFSDNTTFEVIAAVVAAAEGAYQYSAAEVALFSEEEPHHQHGHDNKEALHISAISKSYNIDNAYINAATTRTTGGPQRSSSLSPVVSFAPYTSPVISCASLSRSHQHNHNHNHYHHLSQQQEYHSKQDQDQNDDDDAMSTYSSSSSLSSAPSSRACSPETSSSTTSSTATTTTNTTIATVSEDGTTTTTITNQKDGSIMCFNRTTGQMSFRCDLCPSPTADQHPQSFGRIHDLRRHQATKHATPEGGCAKTFPCEFCEKPFARRDALLRHYSVKAQKEDGIHPTTEEVNVLAAVRARAKLI